jgi:hypothetical protein
VGEKAFTHKLRIGLASTNLARSKLLRISYFCGLSNAAIEGDRSPMTIVYSIEAFLWMTDNSVSP